MTRFVQAIISVPYSSVSSRSSPEIASRIPGSAVSDTRGTGCSHSPSLPGSSPAAPNASAR